MLPIPSRGAFYAFAGCTAMLAVAIAASSPLGAVLSGSGFVALAVALMLTMPLGARLRRERLEFAWWQAHAEDTVAGSALAGGHFELRCYVRNRSTRTLCFTGLQPILPPGTRLLSGADADLILQAHARTEFSFVLSPAAAGRCVLQGLAVAVPGPLSLFHAPLYFPSPLSIKVLPRSAARRAALDMVAGGQQVERAGLRARQRRGGGTELHEIREHRPGDAFKAIAWKPSARAGKLMVREVENEVQETIYLLLDISGSMRAGAPGERKLDHGIELCAITARTALERGDRVGMITVDGRVVDHVAPAEGAGHLLRLYDALLRATEPVDEDLTEVDDEGVVEVVLRYLRHQEGRELSARPEPQLEELVRHAQRALSAEREQDTVVASSPAHATLRRFCRLRGIPLPYRADTRAFAKGHGLARALRMAGGQTRMPRTLLCITDLDGVFQLDPLLKTLAMLRARHHSVAFLFPEAESLTPAHAEDHELERQLRRIYGSEEQRRRQAASAALTRLGVPLLGFGAREDKAAVARRAAAFRRVA